MKLSITDTHIAIIVSHRARDIGSVDGWHERDVFPVFSLQVLEVCHLSWGLVLRTVGFVVVFFGGHASLLDVEALEDPLVAIDGLLYGIGYFDVLQVVNVELFLPWLPFFGRDNLENVTNCFTT